MFGRIWKNGKVGIGLGEVLWEIGGFQEEGKRRERLPVGQLE
jgi:hypothetical protein